MFFLCVINKRTAASNENIQRDLNGESKTKITHTGNDKPATMEPSETNFQISSTRMNVANAQIVARGWSPMHTPAIVATPFPPLNPANKGNT